MNEGGLRAMERGLRLIRGFGKDAIVRRLLTRAGPSTVATIASAVFGMARSAILVRALGVDDFGRLAIIVSAGTVVRQLFSVRTWEWTTVELAAAHVDADARRMREVVRIGSVLGIATAALATTTIVLAAAPLARLGGGAVELAPLVATFGAMHLVSAFDEVALSTMRVAGWFGRLSALQIGAAVIRLVSTVPLLFVTDGLSSAVLLSVLAQIPASVAFAAAAVRAFRSMAVDAPPTRVQTIRGEWRRHARTLATMSVTDTVRSVGLDADPMVIGALSSPIEVGEFKTAQAVMMGLHSLATPLYSVFYPELARAVAANDVELVRALKHRLTLLGLAFGGTATLGTLLLGPWILGIIFGRDVEASRDDIRLMAPSMLIMMAHWANPLFASLGRTGRSTAMLVLGLAAKFGCFAWLVPRLGSSGAAVGFTAYFAASLVAAYALSRDYERLLVARAARARTGTPSES